MAKVFDLAKKNIKKTDEAKALESLTEKVEDNKMQFELDLHNAKKEVKAAVKVVAGLDGNPEASANDIIKAERAVAVANKNVEAIETIIKRRF